MRRISISRPKFRGRGLYARLIRRTRCATIDDLLVPSVRCRLPFVPRTPPLRGAGEVVPVEVHDLVPGCHEVVHELLLRVVARIDLRDGPQLGIRAEDQVDPAARPSELASGAVAAREGLRGRALTRGGGPLR